MKQTKNSSLSQKHEIHWNAVGAGLVTAAFIYPEQQTILLSMGGSSFITGVIQKLSKRRQQSAIQ